MNKFDDFVKKKIKVDSLKVPDNVKYRVDETLSKLPKKEYKAKLLPKMMSAAACVAVLGVVVLPNVSSAYAQAMEKIPVISDIVKIVTIRNYFYSDANHEMNINVPKIEGENSEAADYINKSVEELTKILADRFDKDLEEIGEEGHSSVYVDYDVVTNTPKWFTLKIQVFEAAGSSNTYYKYYHIDKENGKIVRLGDIVDNDKFYTACEEEIKKQMRAKMAEDENLIYWVDDTTFGDDIIKLDAEHNFYLEENGDIVFTFDKYEVAPGYMGTPEFTVEKKLVDKYLTVQYR